MSTELNKRFGENLRKYRKECGLTQEEVADKLQISTSFYANVENGNKAMSLTILYRLIKVLDVNLNTLLCDEQDRMTNVNDIVAMLDHASDKDLEFVKNMVRSMLKELAKR